MLRFQAGDRTAFAALVRKHKTPIYNFILRLVRRRPRREDLVQDVFVKIVQSAVDFKHESKFSTWAYAIARNICIDHLRKMSFRNHASLDQAVGQRARRADPARSDGRCSPERDGRAHRHRTRARAAHHAAASRALPEDSGRCSCCGSSRNLPFKDIADDHRGAGEHREEPDALRPGAPPGVPRRVRRLCAGAALSTTH